MHRTRNENCRYLFSGPMGRSVYERAGFIEVTTVNVKLDDDNEPGNEGVQDSAMTWEKAK